MENFGFENKKQSKEQDTFSQVKSKIRKLTPVLFSELKKKNLVRSALMSFVAFGAVAVPSEAGTEKNDIHSNTIFNKQELAELEKEVDSALELVDFSEESSASQRTENITTFENDESEVSGGESAPSDLKNEPELGINSKDVIGVSDIKNTEKISETNTKIDDSVAGTSAIEKKKIVETVDEEAIKKMNEEALKVIEDFSVIAKLQMVQDVKDHFPELVKYAEGENTEAVNKVGKNLKKLMLVYKTALDDLKTKKPKTHQKALGDVKTLLGIVKENTLPSIPKAIKEWSKLR